MKLNIQAVDVGAFVIASCTDSSEFQFYCRILPFASTFEDTVGQTIGLIPLPKEPKKTLDAKLKAYLVRIPRIRVFPLQSRLVYDRCNNREFRLRDEVIHIGHEFITSRDVLQKFKGRKLLSNFALVKYYCIVTEPFEFDILKIRANIFYIDRFSENTECEDKNRKSLVDLNKVVIAALINVYDVVAETQYATPIL